MTTQKLWNLMKYQIYPSAVSYHTIQSFDHPSILNMFMSMELYQTQTHIYINFWLINDDFDEEALKILSNLLSIFGQKIFSSQLGIRIQRMRSSLIRSNWFLIDWLTTFIHTPSYLEHPVYILMSCLGMNQNMGSCA